MQYTDRLTDHWLVRELCRPSDWPALERDEAAQANLRRLAVTCLEPLRVAYAAPLLCISGYRSPTHNARVRGAKLSKHMLAQASDITPAGVNWNAIRSHYLGRPKYRELTRQMGLDIERVRALEILAEHMLGRELAGVGGIGYYPQSGWLHLDVRERGPGGHVYRWIGDGFGSEIA